MSKLVAVGIRDGETLMISLDLKPDEVDMLREILDSYLSDLRMEIANTDSMDFREMLKQRKEVIGKVLRVLGETPTA